MTESPALELALRLRDLTRAQLEAIQDGSWERALQALEERGRILAQLELVKEETLPQATREAIANLLAEVQELDRQLIEATKMAMEAIREAQRNAERNDAAARSYRRALGAIGEAQLLDEEV